MIENHAQVYSYGSNLAPDTRQWAGSDFSGNNAPTTLGTQMLCIAVHQ